MKTLAIGLIKFYQRLVSPFWQIISPVPVCKHSLSCSEYAIRAIKHHGFLAGSVKSVVRILSCNPLTMKLFRKT